MCGTNMEDKPPPHTLPEGTERINTGTTGTEVVFISNSPLYRLLSALLPVTFKTPNPAADLRPLRLALSGLAAHHKDLHGL